MRRSRHVASITALPAAIALLSGAVASCASAAGSGGQSSPSVVAIPASASAAVSPSLRVGLPTAPTSTPASGPTPDGCLSGTATITHRPTDPAMSGVCVSPGTRLRLTLTIEGEGGWTPFHVIPQGAVTVASTTDSAGVVHAIVSPAGTKNFCLSTMTTSPTAPAENWLLCVTIHG